MVEVEHSNVTWRFLLMRIKPVGFSAATLPNIEDTEVKSDILGVKSKAIAKITKRPLTPFILSYLGFNIFPI